MEGGLLFRARRWMTKPLSAIRWAYAGPESNIALGLSYGWHHKLKGFFMVASANSAKIATTWLSRRTITFCVMAAALVALVVSWPLSLYGLFIWRL